MSLGLIETLVMVLHVAAALAIIGLVLIQQGRGADMGSGFGGGASNTVFGSGGSGTFLTRATTTIAIAFFLTSFGLAFFAKQHSMEAGSVGIPQVVQERPVEQNAAPETNMATEVPDSDVPAQQAQGASDSEVPEG